MDEMHDVTRIEYQHDHVFTVVFDDGLAADIDLAHYVDRGPVFTPLANPAFFRQARIEGGTIAWPNGADVAPERLYELALAAAEHEAVRR